MLSVAMFRLLRAAACSDTPGPLCCRPVVFVCACAVEQSEPTRIAEEPGAWYARTTITTAQQRWRRRRDMARHKAATICPRGSKERREKLLWVAQPRDKLAQVQPTLSTEPHTGQNRSSSAATCPQVPHRQASHIFTPNRVDKTKQNDIRQRTHTRLLRPRGGIDSRNVRL